MDFLDRIALFLSPKRKRHSSTKKKPLKSVTVTVAVADVDKDVPFNKKRVSFAEKNFAPHEKILNDKYKKNNPYRTPANIRAKELLENILPFMVGRQDWAEWTYRNRYGVFTTVGLYLAVLLGFSMVNFEMGRSVNAAGVYIDVKELEDVVEMLEQMKQEAEENPVTGEVNNQISDENSRTKEDFSYEKYAKSDPMDSRKLLDEQLDNLMEGRQTMRNYISTMDRLDVQMENEIMKSREVRDSLKKVAKENESLHSRKQGNVTVSYELKNRRALFLEMPAYLCEGGGKVVLDIFVNRMGKVVDAVVNKSYGVDDPCVEEMAIWAAKQSYFDVNNSSEGRQKGTMTYIFIAQ